MNQLSKKVFFALSVLFLFLAGIFIGVPFSVSAEETSDLKLGGQLYDNWPKLKGFKAGDNYPLYPDAGKKNGTSTWRCKECHGWDYIGKDGRYSKGSHYTGIKGVLGSAGKNVAELNSALMDKKGNHDFSEYFSEKEIAALAAFLSSGLMDIRPYLNYDGSVKGHAANGRNLYAANCSSCHGPDGNAIDFSGKEGIQGVGWLAWKNPQETLHKIRWGHPGSDMPSMVTDAGVSYSGAVDILKYSQTLK